MSGKAWKIIKVTVSSVAILLIIVVVIAYFSLNSIVAGGIRTFGTKATGTKIEVRSVVIAPFGGSIDIKGLSVANPRDCQSRDAFTLNSFYANMDMESIFTDKIIINEVFITDVAIDFEPSVSKGSNLQEIYNNISAYTSSEKKEEKSLAQGTVQKPEKKIVIKHLIIQNGTITVSSSLLKNSIKVPMAKVEMYDIGESGDKTAVEVCQEIYGQMIEGVGTSVSGIRGLKIDSINLNGVSSATESIGNELSNGLKSLESSIGL